MFVAVLLVMLVGVVAAMLTALPRLEMRLAEDLAPEGTTSPGSH